jgi:hypothetical protein
MLVPAMNHEEIAAQVKREYQKIYDTTLRRLGAEYDRERRKLRINKENIYPKEYEIKTAGKNNWIIFIHKGPGVKKYTGTESIFFLCVVYYYNYQGLMVFWQAVDVLAGFTSHFFERYNERLCLKILNPIDIVKAFFRKGMYCNLKIVERDNKPHIIAFGVDGLRFGEIKYDYSYVEWKTFVNREMTFHQQDELEHELTNELMQTLKDAERQETYDPIALKRLKNRVVALPLSSMTG